MSWSFLPSSYDRVASAYEAKFVDELDGKPRDRELLAGFRGVEPLLDLGCGPGQIGAFAGGTEVLGLDRSPAMARLATARLGATVVGDMRSLPFAAASLGGVVAFYSLIHLRRDEVPGVMREVARVLRAGGRALVSAHEGDGEHEVDEFLGIDVPFAASLFSLDELVATFEAAALDVVLAERRPPYDNEGPTVRLYVEGVKR